MPWKDVTVMELRREFVQLAEHGGIPFAQVCRRFGISPQTGRKWRDRYRADGEAGLGDRSRRPHGSPNQTPPATVDAIQQLVDQYPTWGGRKIKARLEALGLVAPAASTITAIVSRDQLRPPVQPPVQPVIRFDAAAPNDRWQMDFKSPESSPGGRILPLTVLDDHSRLLLLLEHVPDQTFATVQTRLIALFRRYGLPWQLLTDNGPPWGSSRAHTLTQMDVWLIQLAIRPRHGRVYHPQTQGKVERFHRTLRADLFQLHTFASPAAAQIAMQRYREVYNMERPHEHLGMQPPISHYRPSLREYPETLPEIVYDTGVTVRTVSAKGTIRFQGQVIFLSEALQGLPVGLSPTLAAGVYRVQFASYTWRTLDLRDTSSSCKHRERCPRTSG
jgi:transposase InsO family protein